MSLFTSVTAERKNIRIEGEEAISFLPGVGYGSILSYLIIGGGRGLAGAHEGWTDWSNLLFLPIATNLGSAAYELFRHTSNKLKQSDKDALNVLESERLRVENEFLNYSRQEEYEGSHDSDLANNALLALYSSPVASSEDPPSIGGLEREL